jgi:hypothetical protein
MKKGEQIYRESQAFMVALPGQVRRFFRGRSSEEVEPLLGAKFTPENPEMKKLS